MPIFVLLIALVVGFVGASVVAANPRRKTNRAFGFISLMLTAWLVCVYKTMVINLQMRIGAVVDEDPTLWHRINATLAACLPWSVWNLKQSIAPHSNSPKLHSLFWASISLILMSLCWNKSYITVVEPGYPYHRGFSYVLYSIGLAGASIALSIQVYVAIRQETGIRRVELQFLALNVGISGVLAVTFNSIGAFLGAPSLSRLSPLVVLACWCSIAWALTVDRIFDTKQITVAYAQRIALFILVGVGAWITHTSFGNFAPPPADYLINLTIWGAIGLWLDKWSRRRLDLDGTARVASMRRDVIALAQTETDPVALTLRFENFLRDSCQTQSALVLQDSGTFFSNQTLEIEKQLIEQSEVSEFGWATPERLERRRFNAENERLQQFLKAQSLGLLLVAPKGSAAPSLVLAFGEKLDASPFTYPEIERLQNIAELMDNILTHARLTNQAALQAKMEHLAMMSRGLAHDLKNLITPVSSFLVHTDGQYAPDSPEAEVHDAAKRSVRIMTDYVREALFFSERLAPKFEPVSLSRTFAGVREVTQARAGQRRVALVTECSYDGLVIADAVLLQRMLANLVANAIDASPAGQTVTLAASSLHPGVLRIQVSDQGCGVAPEHLGRIFEPYFTTKEFGDDVRGFGLGLTICQKISDLHGAVISVKSDVGRGTTITVDLPSQQGGPALGSSSRLARLAGGQATQVAPAPVAKS